MKVFAEFLSVEEAELACGRVKRQCEGECAIRKIDCAKLVNRSMTSPSDFSNSYTQSIAYTPYPVLQPGASVISMGSNHSGESQLPEVARRRSCLMCFSGDDEQVWRASHMLRGLGGLNINVSDAAGKFTGDYE
ncbi:MAG: hypothetical protein LBL82_06905 [Oscillospiraceae bacterium]|jgi:hypothetical protein|nr:hypothetical protein [Oscillospiraceae bacterium]